MLNQLNSGVQGLSLSCNKLRADLNERQKERTTNNTGKERDRERERVADSCQIPLVQLAHCRTHSLSH